MHNCSLENLYMVSFDIGTLIHKTDLWILHYVSTKQTPYHECYIPDGH